VRKILLILSCVVLFSGMTQAAILTVFSDNGISGTNLFTWPGGASGSIFQSSVAVPSLTVAPEGKYTMLTQPISGGFDGWGVFYLSGGRPSKVDLSQFQNGEIRFWLYTTTANMTLSFEHLKSGVDCQGNFGTTSKDCFDFNTVLGGLLNQWVLVTVPMIGPGYSVDMKDLYSPFEITANVGATFYIDDVRYVDSKGTPVFNVAIKNVSNQQPASVLTWSGGLTANWVRADQYLELAVDPYNNQTWGVQIYTDNKGSGANPTFSTTIPAGKSGSNPAGLVDMQKTSATLPLAWSIKAGTQTAIAAEPATAEPNDNGQNGNPTDPHAFQWLYMEDAQTPAIPSENTNQFQNGNSFVTVQDNAGIHFGQSDFEFGAQYPPNYIYLEANFKNALTPQTYQTSTLRVEFFTP